MSVTDNRSDPSTEQESAPEQGVDELHQPLWSVISFERCEAARLVYDEAFKILEDLEAQGVTGLCIVTDSAAEKVVADKRSKL